MEEQQNIKIDSRAEEIFKKYQDSLSLIQKNIDLQKEQIDTNKASKVLLLVLNALNELGYKEENKNENKYAREIDSHFYSDGDYKNNVYNGIKNSQAWCDVFVDYLFLFTFGKNRALELLNQKNQHKSGAGVGMSFEYFEEKVKNEGQKPLTGSQVFFESFKHTGLVVGSNDKYVYVMEGNTLPQTGEVIPEGLGVCLKKYPLNSKKIWYYGIPPFSENEMMTKEEEEVIQKIIEYIYCELEKLMDFEIKEEEKIEDKIFGVEKLMDSLYFVKRKLVLIKESCEWLKHTLKKKEGDEDYARKI